jgi:hypothetical protein
MYIQTRSITAKFGPRAWYHILREHNHFSVLASARYALWLAYGNQAMPPGELGAWAEAQVEAHPLAIGVALGLWLSVLAVFIGLLISR